MFAILLMQEVLRRNNEFYSTVKTYTLKWLGQKFNLNKSKIMSATDEYCSYTYNSCLVQITKPSRLFERTKPAPCSIEENEAAVQTDSDSLEHAHHTLQVQEYSNDAFGKPVICYPALVWYSTS